MKQVEVEVKVEVEMYETFRDMPVWQQAIDVAERIFGLTEGLPRKEDYGFTSQIRRSALSIAANIAEAFGRNHTYDKINFYYISRGSVAETQSHLEYGRRVGYIAEEDALELDTILNGIYKDLNRLILSLKRTSQ